MKYVYCGVFLLEEDFEHVTQLYENEIFSLESNANSLKYNKVL